MASFPAGKASKEEHRSRMALVESWMTRGAMSGLAAYRRLSRDTGISQQQARRYVRAVEAIYRREPTIDRVTLGRAVLARSEDAAAAGAFGPSIRALELYADLHGYLTTKVEVSGTVQHQHVATSELSTDELLALQAFHDARQRRLTEGSVVVESSVVVDEASASNSHNETPSGEDGQASG